MTRFVLASGSPRRRDILTALGLAFDVRPPAVDETLRPGEAATAAARRLAEEKATAVDAADDEIVLAADTIVVLDDDLLGKPSSPAEAVEMIGRLSGRDHAVITGIALRADGVVRSAAARTDVIFRRLSGEEIDAYVATGEPLDKAGGYGIQGYGSALVERIEGDFFNVMGLPVPTLLELLLEAGLRYLYGAIVAYEPGTDARAGSTPGIGDAVRAEARGRRG